MKLSDAIEVGCVGKRQIVGSYYDGKGGVCAMGAAALALGEAYFYIHGPARLSALSNYSYKLHDLVQKWNDDYGFTFQEIVARLREIGK